MTLNEYRNTVSYKGRKAAIQDAPAQWVTVSTLMVEAQAESIRVRIIDAMNRREAVRHSTLRYYAGLVRTLRDRDSDNAARHGVWLAGFVS